MWGEMRFSQPQMLRNGFTPQECYWMEQMEKEAARSKEKTAGGGLGFLNFIKGMKEISTLANDRGYHLPCTYIFEDKVVAQIEKVEWTNTKGSAGHLLYLTKMYCLDMERGSGVGTRFMEEIKRVVDETGMVLFLFAASFSFSGEDNGLPYAFLSMDELLKQWEQEEKLTETDGDILLIDWYKKLGFLNACTHDGENWPAKDYHRLDKQFLYVGKNNPQRDFYLERAQFENMCKTCKLQIKRGGMK